MAAHFARSSARVFRVVVLASVLTQVACVGPLTLVPPPTIPDDDYLRALRMMVPVAGVAPGDLRDAFRDPRGDRRHEAIDIFAARGTPVIAAVDGRILRVSNNTLGGNTIYATDHARRFVYYYAHLDRYAERARVGARIRKGQVIGYVGTTGNAPENTPHLHFQVMRMSDDREWWSGRPVNPYGLFSRAGVAR